MRLSRGSLTPSPSFRPVPARMTRSPTRQPVTGSPRVTTLEPFWAVSAIFTQVRESGLPCTSQRPPQQTIAGHSSGSSPGTAVNRMTAVWPGLMGRSGMPTSSAGRSLCGSGAIAWLSQSKPDSRASSPAWILISPTSSRVSRSGSKRSVPATWIERIAASVFVSKVTRCPSRTCTRAPPAGTFPPSQVAGSDQFPFAVERISGDPGSLTLGSGAASRIAIETRTFIDSLSSSPTTGTLGVREPSVSGHRPTSRNASSQARSQRIQISVRYDFAKSACRLRNVIAEPGSRRGVVVTLWWLRGLTGLNRVAQNEYANGECSGGEAGDARHG